MPGPKPTSSMARKAKDILGASQKRRSTPHGSSIFAQKPQCSCTEDATGAWAYIKSMSKVSLDVIIAASSQAIDFSVKWQDCQSCPSLAVVNEIVLQIYEKLIDLLQASIVTYTSPNPQLSTSEPPSARTGRHPLPHTKSSPIPEVVCLPPVMSLGEFWLDEQQSRYLALDIVCRTLKNLASVLQQMRQQETMELNKMDRRADKLFSRVIRLLHKTLASRSSLQ